MGRAQVVVMVCIIKIPPVCFVSWAPFLLYSQLRQNDLNSYFQTKVGKEGPKQFPEPFSVGKQNVGNFHFHILQRHAKQEIT